MGAYFQNCQPRFCYEKAKGTLCHWFFINKFRRVLSGSAMRTSETRIELGYFVGNREATNCASADSKAWICAEMVHLVGGGRGGILEWIDRKSFWGSLNSGCGSIHCRSNLLRGARLPGHSLGSLQSQFIMPLTVFESAAPSIVELV